MEKGKFTPGPWEVHKQKDSGMGNCGSHFEILHPLINPDGEYKGQLGGYHIVVGETDTTHDPKITEANARLIAAAPDLLEACKDAMEVIDDIYAANKPIQKLKLAISKAEGNQ